MKRLIPLLMALCVLSASAATKVIDTDGEAVIGAAIFDRNGTLLGITSDSGMLPEISAASYPLTLRAIGFADTKVHAQIPEVVMALHPKTLGEVSVTAEERPECRVVCFSRETIGAVTGKDTLRIVFERMVDFMLPAFDAKKLVTWGSPRILNQRMEFYSSNPESKIDRSDAGLLSFFYVRIDGKKHKLPEKMCSGEIATDTITSKKTGEPMAVWRKMGDNYNYYYDVLADYEGHKMSPTIFKLFGMTSDITEMWRTVNFSGVKGCEYDFHNFNGVTQSLKILMKGKLIKALLSTPDPIEVHDYIELYPVDVTYLTREEAKALKKNMDTYPFTYPQ